MRSHAIVLAVLLSSCQAPPEYDVLIVNGTVLDGTGAPGARADVAISNGVINLSPRKSRVFAEAHRVLRPGGRLVATDIVVDDDLPPEIFTNPAAWAG